MKSKKILFGNLKGVVKAETSETSEKLAQLRTFKPCKSVDLSKFAANESFNISKDLSKLNISELIERIKFGCSDSFNILDLEIRDYLRIISVGRANSSKKNTSMVFDCVQDTILKVYNNILVGGFDNVETKDHLLNKSKNILNNIIYDIDREGYNRYYSKTRLFKTSENGECELNLIDEHGQRSNFINDEFLSDNSFNDSQKLEKSLNKLSNTQKTIIELYYFKGSDHEDIANELDISKNSSMLKLSRARKKLKDLYLA